MHWKCRLENGSHLSRPSCVKVWDSHYKHITIMRSCYVYKGNCFIGKMASFTEMSSYISMCCTAANFMNDPYEDFCARSRHQGWGQVQYIPRNMHTVFALLCFVVVIHWLILPYPSGLLHWHCGNLTIAPVPAKQPWWIWINTSCEFIMNDCITTTKQSTTKPCAYFLGYTVHPIYAVGCKYLSLPLIPASYIIIPKLWMTQHSTKCAQYNTLCYKLFCLVFIYIGWMYVTYSHV